MKIWGTAALILLLVTLARAQNALPPSKPYPLPEGVQHTIADLAERTDVLILGEMHGTQETPAIAAALLEPLTKQGYGILALEVNADQQVPLIAWATGKSSKIPWFYSAPSEDGRGSAQMLALIRTALSPPFRWRLICFDQSIESMLQEYKAMTKEQREEASGPAQGPPPKWTFALGLKRDAEMADIFSTQRKQIGGKAKTLAICGDLHARTANHYPPDSVPSKLYPSFAANLQTAHPTWRINSIDLNPHVGEFYNSGKINKMTDKPIDEPVARELANQDWNLNLDFPKATAATFLTTPSNETLEAVKAQVDLPKKRESESGECECYSRRGH